MGRVPLEKKGVYREEYYGSLALCFYTIENILKTRLDTLEQV